MRMVEVRILPPQPVFWSLGFFDWESGPGPAAPPAVHRDHVGVAHFLQIVSGQRRTEAAAAIKSQRRRFIGESLLDVPLDDTLAQMHGAGQATAIPFGVLAHVYEK